MSQSAGFGAEPERLAAAGTEFESFADRAGTIAGELRATLGSSGTPWGEDAVGRNFAATHEAGAAETLERLHGLAAGLRDLASRFTDSAAAYADTDADAARAIVDRADER